MGVDVVLLSIVTVVDTAAVTILAVGVIVTVVVEVARGLVKV